MKTPCRCDSPPRAVPVEVADEVAEDLSVGTRIVGWLCPDCLGDTERPLMPDLPSWMTPREQLAALHGAARDLVDGLEVQGDAVVLSKRQHDTYLAMMKRANLIRDALRAEELIGASA